MLRGRINVENLCSLFAFMLVLGIFGEVTGWWVTTWVLCALVGWFHPFVWEPGR